MNHAAVRPVLLDYFCSDIVDVEKWKPVDDRIDYSIELSIGTALEEGADLYQVRIVDAKTLEQEAPVGVRATVVVDAKTYSFGEVRAVLERLIEGCARKTWAECSLALNRWFHWEYEDHRFG